MSRHSAAVVAAGSQGRVHAFGYSRLEGVRLAGVADVDLAAAESLAGRYQAAAFTDYRVLIDELRPELLSICTPPAMHREVFEYAVARGVRGIHAEKPIALTWADARGMVELAERKGVRFSVNHQRRFDVLHRAVRAELLAGAIGDVVGIDGFCGNLFDWGSHLVDLMFFYLGDRPAESVLGQIDVAARKLVYGAPTETAAVSHIRFGGGVNGIVLTGRDYDPLTLLGGNGLVISGTTGRIEVFGETAVIRATGAPERTIAASVDSEFEIDLGGAVPTIIQGTAFALAELADAVDTGRELTLDARHGLAAAEVIFATYESSAARARVSLPLQADDNALVRGLELGYWTPTTEIVSTF